MDHIQRHFTAILVILLLYVLAMIMRRGKVLQEEHSLILARLVTDLCLPATIFVNLAGTSITLSRLNPALEMLALELICIALAWVVSYKLNFSKKKQGAIVFCSAFGSSSFLGYPLILQMFPAEPDAITEAVIISEIGVGIPIFILGPILASYFGSSISDKKAILSASFGFVISPVFIALVAGILWGKLKLPTEENVLLAPLFQAGQVLGAALTPIAILSIGLMFRFPGFRTIWKALIVVVIIKLMLKPLMGAYGASLFDFSNLWKDVIIILAAMPPAILGAVFLRRYGGDACLASTLVMAAGIMSVFTMIAVFYLLG